MDVNENQGAKETSNLNIKKLFKIKEKKKISFQLRRSHDNQHDNQSVRFMNLPKPRAADITNTECKQEIDILTIKKIEPLLILNGKQHYTSLYELMSRNVEPALVVRRGQTFKIDLHFHRTYREDTDYISFIFTVADEEKPSYGQGTIVGIPLMNKIDENIPWNAVLDNLKENKITVLIKTAANCIVAKWKLDVDTRRMNDDSYSYSWSTPIYILFNPWCPEDQVYMESEEWRTECVLEDVGLIWRGCSNSLRPSPWNYGQFQKDILDCTLYLIKYVGKVNGHRRSDPISISRALCAAVNSYDDNGVLVGNWSAKYDGGTCPLNWIGSVDILQKYYNTKKPVKYGQCWVFAGILTTNCRAIGIPTRPVTNFSSAHDTQGSLTIDCFLNEKGDDINELNSDTIWNYHVWNEIWMRRPDLSNEYDGWQVIDATAQDISDNMYKCGPCSVYAIKEGEIMKPYDASYIFSEINANILFWLSHGPTQPLKLLRKDTDAIGLFLSTKAPDKFVREDITNNYKYPERSQDETNIMLKVLNESSHIFSRYCDNENFNDVNFNIQIKDNILIGQSFNVCVLIRNNNTQTDYKVQVVLKVSAETYTGILGNTIKEETFNVRVEKMKDEKVKLNVSCNDYLKLLLDQASFNITCFATVDGTNYQYIVQDNFRVRKPDISIVIPKNPVKNKVCTGAAILINPLTVPLKKGMFKVEGPGINKLIKVTEPIAPEEYGVVEFNFKPMNSGSFAIVAKFTSKELNDCDGYSAIFVDNA